MDDPWSHQSILLNEKKPDKSIYQYVFFTMGIADMSLDDSELDMVRGVITIFFDELQASLEKFKVENLPVLTSKEFGRKYIEHYHTILDRYPSYAKWDLMMLSVITGMSRYES